MSLVYYFFGTRCIEINKELIEM